MAQSYAELWTSTLTIPELEIEEIDQPALESSRILQRHYQDLADGDGLPLRRDIDPLTIPRMVLPSVYLLEPINDYDDWIYRLIGTEIVERFQVDRTGQSLKFFMPENRATALIEQSNRVARDRKPAYFRLRPKNTAMERFYAETMSLPVLDPKTDKVWLFGGTFFGGAVIE